jgi:hypothetical protein
MKPTELHIAIMSREDCTLEEAEEMVREMRVEVQLGGDPEEVLFDWGFEPDYFMDII